MKKLYNCFSSHLYSDNAYFKALNIEKLLNWNLDEQKLCALALVLDELAEEEAYVRRQAKERHMLMLSFLEKSLDKLTDSSQIKEIKDKIEQTCARLELENNVPPGTCYFHSFYVNSRKFMSYKTYEQLELTFVIFDNIKYPKHSREMCYFMANSLVKETEEYNKKVQSSNDKINKKIGIMVDNKVIGHINSSDLPKYQVDQLTDRKLVGFNKILTQGQEQPYVAISVANTEGITHANIQAEGAICIRCGTKNEYQPHNPNYVCYNCR